MIPQKKIETLSASGQPSKKSELAHEFILDLSSELPLVCEEDFEDRSSENPETLATSDSMPEEREDQSFKKPVLDFSNAHGPFPSAFKAYLTAANKFKLLTKEEEQILAARVQAGDRAAKREMIERNLRLVIKAARFYSSHAMELLDLIEEGNLGLIRAIEKFDPSRGFRLSTYAMLWIKQSIERALMLNSSSMVKLPIHVTKALHRHRKELGALSKKLGRKPLRNEILEHLKISAKMLDRFDLLSEYTKSGWKNEDSKEDPFENHRESGRETPMAQEQIRIMKNFLHRACNILNPRQREILVRRFGLLGQTSQTLSEVGEAIQLTRERVRQIQIEALALLKVELSSSGISLKDLELEEREL